MKYYSTLTLRVVALASMLMALSIIDAGHRTGGVKTADAREESGCSDILLCDGSGQNCQSASSLEVTWEEEEPDGEPAYCDGGGDGEIRCKLHEVTSCEVRVCKPGKRVFSCSGFSISTVPPGIMVHCGWEPGPEECYVGYLNGYLKMAVE